MKHTIRKVESGILTRIERLTEDLSILTIVPIDGGSTRTTFPAYMEVPEGLIGKPVDLVTYSSYFGTDRVRQELIGPNSTLGSRDMPIEEMRRIRSEGMAKVIGKEGKENYGDAA